MLAGKTTKSTRYVVNAGLGIFGDPTVGDRQTDLLIYGLSIAQAVARRIRAGGGSATAASA